MAKIKLSKQQWEFIGKRTGWIKTAETTTTYKDKNNTNRTLTLSGPDTINPYFIYTATIKDELGIIESVFSGTLAKIYLAAKERNFAMPESVGELQGKAAKSKTVIKTADLLDQDIDIKLKKEHPLIHLFLHKMPNYQPALDIVDNVVNNKVAPENAGITPDIVNQANQIINKVKTQSTTASNKIVVKEAFTLDARIIAAIIIVVMGIWSVAAMTQNHPKTQGDGFTQAEQLQQLMSQK